VRIQTKDAAGATYSEAFTITVTNANDAPEITSDAAAALRKTERAPSIRQPEPTTTGIPSHGASAAARMRLNLQ
jgi:hypothetical protein